MAVSATRQDDTAAWMRDAMAAHQRGDLRTAEAGYRRILAVNPSHGEALYLSGVIAYQAGRIEEAIVLLQKCLAQGAHRPAREALGAAAFAAKRFDLALKCFEQSASEQPDAPNLQFNLARAAAAQGDRHRAFTAIRKALALRKVYPEAMHFLGVLQEQAGEDAAAVQTWTACLEASPSYVPALTALSWLSARAGRWMETERYARRALAVAPSDADGQYLLANALRGQGRLDEAASVYDTVVRAQPQNTKARDEYGGVLMALGRATDAERIIGEAIALDPAAAHPYTNLGRLFHTDATRAVRALELHEQALARDPELAAAHNNRGVALYLLGRFHEAIASHERAVALKPDMAEAYNNLGNAWQKLGDIDRALGFFDEAIRRQPDYAEAHLNAAIAHLLQGDLANGWREFEWRWRCAAFPFPRRGFFQPLWDGSRRANGSLLVWGEQGVGDEILFGSMVPDLLRGGWNVIWEMDWRLVPLIQRSVPGIQAIARSTPAHPLTEVAPLQSPAASLGRYLRTAERDFPKAPYLRADAARTAAYRRILGRGAKRVVGLSWISRNAQWGEHKTLALSDLAPVLTIPDTIFVDLQYGETAAERATVKESLGIEIVRPPDLDLFNDLDGLAAAVSACDLVISVSNTTAHLAGALGVPVWVMVPSTRGRLWCWGADGDRSLWYSSAMLFRQSMSGAWGDAVDRMAMGLRALPAP